MLGGAGPRVSGTRGPLVAGLAEAEADVRVPCAEIAPKFIRRELKQRFVSCARVCQTPPDQRVPENHQLLFLRRGEPCCDDIIVFLINATMMRSVVRPCRPPISGVDSALIHGMAEIGIWRHIITYQFATGSWYFIRGCSNLSKHAQIFESRLLVVILYFAYHPCAGSVFHKSTLGDACSSANALCAHSL